MLQPELKQKGKGKMNWGFIIKHEKPAHDDVSY